MSKQQKLVFYATKYNQKQKKTRKKTYFYTFHVLNWILETFLATAESVTTVKHHLLVYPASIYTLKGQILLLSKQRSARGVCDSQITEVLQNVWSLFSYF